MLFIIGIIILSASVLGGYVLSHGDLLALWQPFEMIIICGAAFGAFLVSNPRHVVADVFKKMPSLLAGVKYDNACYMDLLAMLYEVFSKSRREGMMAIETDIETPEESVIFTRYPAILKDKHMINFIVDYLRLVSSGNMSAFELENLMDMEISTREEELEAPVTAVTRVADSLPGFGIVAAVLGIVITMKSMGGPPEVLGVHVAAALVGTFLGILMAYGFVGPMSYLLGHKMREELQCYECIKACMLATVNGVPPQLAVEFGRKTIFTHERPTFIELEEHVRGQ